MKIEITIALNKESQELVQNTLNKVVDNIASFVDMLEKFSTKADSASVKADSEAVKSDSVPVKADDVNVKSDNISNEPKKAEPIKPQKVKAATKPILKNRISSKKKKNATEAIFNIIKKSGGISVEDLKKETGFDSKKIADVVYRLKKSSKIQKDDNNRYIIVQ